MADVARLQSLKRLLPLVFLATLAMAGGSVASPASCRLSNCQFTVQDECQHSERVYCNLNKQSITKVTITETSFPKHVREITISNVQEMEIQADAIASLASLETIELTHIGILTLLPRSLARTNDSGPLSVTIQQVKSLLIHPETFADWLNPVSKITIEDVDECHMLPKTITTSTQIRSLHLVRINSLTIDHDAFAAGSAVENMWLTEVKSLTVKTGAVAQNATIQLMQLEEIASLTLHTSAFARNSFIHNAVIDTVTSLLIDSGGIQADISKLTIRKVAMTACEDSTFGSTIQTLSLTSSHINIIKSGCISASADWKILHIENSRFDRIESLAIRGPIDQVHIEDSNIGTIETGGFTLNVTRLTMEGSVVGELSEKALDVYAAEVITLRKCNVSILRKHAFRMLQLDSSAKERIRIEYLRILKTEKESMQFAPGTDVEVWRLELGTPCTCKMENLVFELGLSSRMRLGHGNDLKASRWFQQTRCVSNKTSPTLAEYHQEYCPEPGTESHGSPGFGSTLTGSFSGWDAFCIVASLILIAVALLVVRRCLRKKRFRRYRLFGGFTVFGTVRNKTLEIGQEPFVG